MSVELLVREFERVSDAPGAIARLRRFILELAVQGNLVAQDPSNEPASELLRRFSPSKPSTEDRGGDPQAEYEIPVSWLWCRVSDIGRVIGGGTPTSSQSDCFAPSGTAIAWLTPADLGHQRGPKRASHGRRDLTKTGLESCGATVMPAGTVLFTSRAPIGYVAIAANEVATNQGFKSVVPSPAVIPEYVAIFFQAFAPRIDAMAPGTTFREVSGKIVAALPFPLAPLAEQHRIVAKVDQLMALCDGLEDIQRQREAQRDELRKVSLQRLTSAEHDRAASPVDVRFFLQQSPRLITKPEHVPSVRQTILDLATSGRLLAPRTYTEYELLPIGSVATLQNGYAFKSEWFSSVGIRLLRNVNVGHARIDWDQQVCLPNQMAQEFERFLLREGDVVVSLDRPFITTGTKVAIVQRRDLPCLLLQRVGRFQIDARRLDANYLYLWTASPFFNRQIDPGRSNGVPHISSKQVEAAEISLPPLAVQHRIVAKVHQLLEACDDLEAAIASSQNTRSRLLEALLREALDGSVVRETPAPGAS